MSDRDVQALKEFRAEIDSDGDGALARVRHRIARTTHEPAPKRRWIAALATGAVAAAVLMGTIVALQPGGAVAPGAADQTASKPTPSASRVPGERAVTLPRQEPGPLTAAGLTVGPSQLLYARSRSTAYRQEQWSEPNGMITIAIQRTDGGVVTVSADEESMKPEADGERARFAASGPSVERPTQQYLAGLPTDKQSVRATIVDALKGDRGDRRFKGTTDWLYRVEPILTPDLRSGLIAALSGLPHVKVDHSARTFDGRAVYVVQQQDGSGVDGLIVDVATGRIIGSYAAGKNIDAWSTATRWEYSVVTR